MALENFKQKLKGGTHQISFFECENPKESGLTYKNSEDEKPGHRVIVSGEKAIRRFIDWLNTLDL